jgi:heme oxygenase
MKQPSLRFFLRAATTSRHVALEDVVGPVETLSAYRRYLLGMYLFRAPVERALASRSYPAPFQSWRPLELHPLLAADAADLGVDLPDSDGAAELEDDPARIAGLLYVMEGSSLGAQLTYRTASQFGMTETHGARHLALQAGSIDNWRQFAALLDAQTEIDREALVAGADDAFLMVTRAFQSLDHAEHLVAS